MNDNADWHAIRAQHIGGSEIAALFNEGHYEGNTAYTLWQVKKGVLEPENLDDKEYVQAGNYLEGGIIAWANHKWQRNFVQPGVYVTHPTVKGMGCTPDAIDRDARLMAQVKKVNDFVFSREWKCEGDEILDAPLHILLQCQHEMACLDIDQSWLIVLVGGMTIKRMLINRDREIGALIEQKVTEFWRSIEVNDEPTPEYNKDGDTINRVRRLKPFTEIVDMSSNNRLAEVVETYIEAGTAVKQWEEHKDAANAEIKHICGNAKVIMCGQRKITLSEVKGSPDSVITQDMVGQVKKGRSGYTTLRIS